MKTIKEWDIKKTISICIKGRIKVRKGFVNF